MTANGSKRGRLAVVPRSNDELRDLAAIEHRLLGSIILAPALLSQLADLESGAFYDPRAVTVWTAIRNLEARGSEITAIAIGEEIEHRDRELGTTRFETLGGFAFIAELVIAAPQVDAIDATEVLHAGAELMRLQRDRAAVVHPDVDAAAERDREETFDEQLARAHADVQAELGRGLLKHREPLFGIDAVDLLARKFDGARWLVTGLITRGGLALIGSEPKTSKTWLATEFSIAVATGTRACGEFTVERGRALYFYAEDLDVQVRNRVRALLKGGSRSLEPGRLYLEPRGKFLDVLVDDDLAWIVASARRLGSLDLLVLDPLRDVHSGEEDKSDSMRDVMRRLRVLTELLDCTVLAVHHAPKATKDNAKRRPGQNLRGSSAIHGSVDSGIYLQEIQSDGTNVFANGVVSQVKGARSAGAFQVDLTVIDNDQGEAIQATWKVTGARAMAAAKSTPAITKADEAYEQDEALIAFVTMLAKRGEAHTRRKLRTHAERPAKVPAGKLPGIVDRCCNRGRLYLEAGVVMVPGVQVLVQHHLEIDQLVQRPDPPIGGDNGPA